MRGTRRSDAGNRRAAIGRERFALRARMVRWALKSRVKGSRKIVSRKKTAGRSAGKTVRVRPRHSNEAGKKGPVKIGIVAIQGDFAAHAAMLQGLGAETVEVRTVEDLEG